ncbi:MAG: twin-arginine translocase TatA/TatE family subunit [Planctomycetota bacterium]
MPFNLSTGELLVLLVVAVLVFGGRLPRVARKVGSAVTDLKRGMRDEMRRMDDDIRPPPPDWRPPQDPEPLEDSDETGK